MSDAITDAVRRAVTRYVSQAHEQSTLAVEPGQWLLMCPAHNNIDTLIEDVVTTVREVAERLPEVMPDAEMAELPVPVVYAWCVDKGGTGNEHWMAIAEDGFILASHVAPNRWAGEASVHLGYRHRHAVYREKFGGLGRSFYRFTVLPDGEQPPAEVLNRMRSWRYPVSVGNLGMAIQVNPLMPKGKAYVVALDANGQPR